MRIAASLVSLFLFLPLIAQDKHPQAPLDNTFFKDFAEKAGVFPPRQDTGNAIVEKKFKMAFENLLQSLPGKQVAWRFKITSVSEKSIRFEPISTPSLGTQRVISFMVYPNQTDKIEYAPNPNIPENPPPRFLGPTPEREVAEAKRLNELRLAASPHAYRFREGEFKVEELETLKKGDSILLEGEIVQYTTKGVPVFPGQIAYSFPGEPHLFILKNCKLTLRPVDDEATPPKDK